MGVGNFLSKRKYLHRAVKDEVADERERVGLLEGLEGREHGSLVEPNKVQDPEHRCNRTQLEVGRGRMEVREEGEKRSQGTPVSSIVIRMDYGVFHKVRESFERLK